MRRTTQADLHRDVVQHRLPQEPCFPAQAGTCQHDGWLACPWGCEQFGLHDVFPLQPKHVGAEGDGLPAC